MRAAAPSPFRDIRHLYETIVYRCDTEAVALVGHTCHIRDERNVTEDPAQHFLASPQARTLTVAQVARMSEDEAYAAFVALRFAENGGEPCCIHADCKCPVVYSIRRKRTCKQTGEVKVRPMFKCVECLRQFSVTSGTPLANHKLSFRDMLMMNSLYTQGVKGVPALQISRMAGHAYMTAFVFCHKLREGLMGLQMAQELTGVVEADSAYFGGSVRKTNRAGPDGKRRARRRTKKWSATVARSRSGGTIMWPSSEKDSVPLMKEKIDPKAQIITDQSPAFNTLGLFFRHHRIDHSKSYAENGLSTNLAESSCVNRRPKRTPYRRAKGTPSSSSVTSMTGAPFALVAA